MLAKTRGIDISHWQGFVDFKKVKSDGFDFVILKAGGSDAGFYKDALFERYYADAKEVNLNVGAYYFTGKNCTSKSIGKADAERFAKLLNGKQFEMPVYIDIEITPKSKKKGATEATIAFCDYMEKAGYYVGIYGSDISVFADALDISKLQKYDKWVARYASYPEYVKQYGIWQYLSSGRVKGITGNVDMDIAFKDYPQIIKTNKLNGFK